MRIMIRILCLFNALTAIPSGVLLMLYPDGRIFQFPPGLLEHTPFRDYFLPGAFLSMMVGGSALVATFAMFRNSGYQYRLAMASGVILIGWILIQTMLLQSVHWLHISYFVIGMLVLILSVVFINQDEEIHTGRNH